MSRKTPSVRFGLVGCGRIATAHLAAISSSERARTVAIAEPRIDAGKAAAEGVDCRHFASHTDPNFLNEIDAVVISTPPDQHFAISEFFLSRGIPTLVEKPLTLDLHSAQTLVEIGESHSALLMMASKFRYVPDMIAARAMIESGLLGKVTLFENSFCSPVPMLERWNSQREISGGGVLIDNGSHSVDIARYLLGPIREVGAQLLHTQAAYDVEDTARIQFKSQSGTLGLIDLSWTIDKESPNYVSLYGSEGTMHIGWGRSMYRLRGNKKWTEFGTGYNKTTAFESQLENFVAASLDGEECLSKPEDALASVTVIEAAYRSAQNDGAWQAVEYPI